MIVNTRQEAESLLARSLSRHIGYTSGAYDLDRIFSIVDVFSSNTSIYRNEIVSILGDDSAGGDDVGPVYEYLTGDRLGTPEYEGKVDSDFMAAKVLADLFRVLTVDLLAQKPLLESIYLFVDEGEVLLDAKATESDLVFSGFRELINGLPYRFAMAISFSVATALIEAIMPNHLLKRLTRQYIEVPMLSDEEAKNFLHSQINFFRTSGSAYVGTFYPFSEEAIEYIIQNINSLTPRNLFISCKRVLERAIRRFGVQPGDEITRDVAERILSGLR